MDHDGGLCFGLAMAEGDWAWFGLAMWMDADVSGWIVKLDGFRACLVGCQFGYGLGYGVVLGFVYLGWALRGLVLMNLRV